MGGWFSQPLKPRLTSVAASMNGVSCLAPYTVHDSRTYELVIINLVQALVFRTASIIVAVFVIRNFGKGLKGAMYALDEEQSAIGRGEVAASEDDESGSAPRARQFVPRTFVKAEQMQPIDSDYKPMEDS